MKKSSLLLAALLAIGGAAFAAEPDSATPSNDTMGAKVRRGAHDVGSSFKQMGRDARHVAHDMTHRRDRHHARGEDTNAGYGGDTRANMTDDGARRQRMDAAYADWQSKH